jgi:hypothetical protein
VSKDKQFVLSIYPDAVFALYDANEIYTGALGWFRGQGFIARVDPAQIHCVAMAHDMLVSKVYNEAWGWRKARMTIEQRMLEKLGQ